MVSREGKVFIVKGVKRKDLESAECAMEGLSDRTSGTAWTASQSRGSCYACLESKLINIQHLNRIDILFLFRVVSDWTFPYSSILRIEERLISTVTGHKLYFFKKITVDPSDFRLQWPIVCRRWPSQGQRTGDSSTINAGFYFKATQVTDSHLFLERG